MHLRPAWATQQGPISGKCDNTKKAKETRWASLLGERRLVPENQETVSCHWAFIVTAHTGEEKT